MSDRPVNEMAVNVARDVLANLDKECHPYTPRLGIYVNSYVLDRFYNQELQTVLDEFQNIGSECKVCALGAILLSKARLYDKIPINYKDTNYYVFREWLIGGLLDVFDREQLDLIEIAFEVSDYVVRSFVSYPTPDEALIHKAVQFGDNYPYHPTDRMRAIMNNIIDNNGHFVP